MRDGFTAPAPRVPGDPTTDEWVALLPHTPEGMRRVMRAVPFYRGRDDYDVPWDVWLGSLPQDPPPSESQ